MNMSLLNHVKAEAIRLRERGGSHAAFVAEQLERVAQLIVFTGAETPEQYDDRVFANEEPVAGAALRARLPGRSGIRPPLSEPVHQLARPSRIGPPRPSRSGRAALIRRSHHERAQETDARRKRAGLGGKATVKKHGPEHMRTIGKAGFVVIRRKFGFMAREWPRHAPLAEPARCADPRGARIRTRKADLSRTPGAPRSRPTNRTRTTRSSRRSWRRSGPPPSPQTEGSEMPRPRLSPEERKQRRREAALKGIAARAARPETATAPADPSADRPGDPRPGPRPGHPPRARPLPTRPQAPDRPPARPVGPPGTAGPGRRPGDLGGQAMIVNFEQVNARGEGSRPRVDLSLESGQWAVGSRHVKAGCRSARSAPLPLPTAHCPLPREVRSVRTRSRRRTPCTRR